jgi:pyruvate formate lyase activating enzyme
MIHRRRIAVREETCLHCGFCSDAVACPQAAGCIGCGICIPGCPQEARQLRETAAPGEEIAFTLDGEPAKSSRRGSVQDVLRELGRGRAGDGGGGACCGSGACWSCAVLADGVLARGCVTALRPGMEIVTAGPALEEAEPRRVVTIMRPYPHRHPSVFTHGCNYRCPACHNWDMTFSSRGDAVSPAHAAAALRLDQEHDYWVGISGGEPTLNRRWLVQTVREIRRASAQVRIQLDTNASVLTPGYIDELAAAGVTDISPDLKALRVESFMALCGVGSRERAVRWLETSWRAVRYLHEAMRGQIFTAVSLPYHPRIHSEEELDATARTLARIDRDLAVTLIEYQPAFRLRDWPPLEVEQMAEARRILEKAGLRRIVVQGGPELPLPVDPLELAIGSEDF